MASPESPQQQVILPLTDPHNVVETFADELTGIQICNGVAHFTFSVIRPKNSTATTHNDPDQVRAVAARIVVPAPVTRAIADSIRQLKAAIDQQSPMQHPPKAN